MRRPPKRQLPAGQGKSSEMPRFPSPWIVEAGPNVASLHVEIPVLRLEERVLKLQEDGVKVNSQPKFLRLDMRRPGFLGKAAPRPVLKADPKSGVSYDCLIVPASLERSITSPPCAVKVTSASERAF